jgi:signal transduction histidine kinase
LRATLNDVLLDLQPLIEEAQAELEVSVGKCPNVAFSARNLRSVVYNLISNALKYRHPDRPPLIRIHCRQTDRYSVLVVEDNGLGLEAHQVRGLFGMFRRFHNHVEGSGIGLYMVKRSVENAGGKVKVESKPGQGTAFSVYFRR